MKAVGVGYRQTLARWIDQRPPPLACLEITAEHFFDHDQGGDRLRDLRRKYPLFVHGLGLSLGTPGALHEPDLARFQSVVDAADPLWISEHVAFTRTDEVDLGHLNPVLPSRETLPVLVDHARSLSDRCGKRLILENITSHLRPEGDLRETTFLNQLCDQAECGLLLDVTNLFINSRNHGFDPVRWLHEIDPSHIVQLHIVGYSHRNGQYMDDHAEPIQSELYDLVAEVNRYAAVQAVIIERDDDLLPPGELEEELTKLNVILNGQ